MRVLKIRTAIGKPKIFKMKNEEGIITSDRDNIAKIIENFYRKLYTTAILAPNIPKRTLMNASSEEISDITTSEISVALR